MVVLDKELGFRKERFLSTQNLYIDVAPPGLASLGPPDAWQADRYTV